MLKIRLQGTLRDIQWFRRILENHKELDVLEVSDAYANKGTSKYFRVYVEVEEKKDKKEKPIAKKIVLPETRRERREEAVFEEDEVKEELPKEEKKTFKFPAISEDDFVDIREKTPTRVEEKPKPVERREVLFIHHLLFHQFMV